MTTKMTDEQKAAKNTKAHEAYARKKEMAAIEAERKAPAQTLEIVPVKVQVKGTKTTMAGEYSIAATGFTTRRQAKKEAKVLGAGHVAFKRGKGDYVVLIVPIGKEKFLADVD